MPAGSAESRLPPIEVGAGAGHAARAPSAGASSARTGDGDGGGARAEAEAGGESAKGATEPLIVRQPSVPDVYLGSKNHPEEEDELYGLRKMMRILGDEEQHNEKLLHALNVLLAMSAVESSLIRMVERGVVSSVYSMLQHFGKLANLFSFDHLAQTDAAHHHGHSTTPPEQSAGNAQTDSAALVMQMVQNAKETMRDDYYTNRRSLFPPLVRPAKEEPFFESLHDEDLKAFSRPPSWVSQASSSHLSENNEPDIREMRDVAADRADTPSRSKKSTPARSPHGSPMYGSPGVRRKDKVKAHDEKVDTSKEENLRDKYGKPKYKKPEKVKFPPPSAAEVLETSLKIIFNLSRVSVGHRQMVLPIRLRFLMHVIAPTSAPSVRFLGLRILVNLTSSKKSHEDVMRSPGLLSSVALALTESDFDERPVNHDASEGNSGPAVEEHESRTRSPEMSSPRSATSTRPNGEPETAPGFDVSVSESKVPEKCKEGDVQFKAMSIICNLSANSEMVPEIYRLPCLLRLKLMEQSALDALAESHAVDKFAFRRHELEHLLAGRRKVNIREKLWAHSDVVKALLETVLHGSDRFRHLVLKMFINFSSDENIAVEMSEGDINLMEPLISLLRNFLNPMHDVLAEEVVEVVVEEEEPVPDPRFLPKVQAFFKDRFHSIFELWVFFDRHDNWSVSVDDVKELSKQLLPEAAGVKLAEIALVMDFKKQKYLDPHDIFRHIAWHELPDGAGKVVPLSRALEEARSRKSKIMSHLNHKMKKLNDQFLKEKAAAKERDRKSRMAARQNAAGTSHAGQTAPSKHGAAASVTKMLAEDTTHKAHSSPRVEEKDAHMHVKPALLRTTSESTQKDGHTSAKPGLQRTTSGSTDTHSRSGKNAHESEQILTPLNAAASPRHMDGDDADDYHEHEEGLPEDEDEDYLAAKAEEVRVKQANAKKKKIQNELDKAFGRCRPEDMASMEMILVIVRNLCKDTETHERLLAELKVIDVIRPLLTMAHDTPYKARLEAQDILNELGEDFQFEDDTFDEAKVQKLGGVAKKWINGVLSSAFNSWVEACKLLHVHTISIFECYRRNAAGKLNMVLPAAAGVACKPLQRFLEDRNSDGLWLGNMGVNCECMKALTFALRGCGIHGTRLRMLNIEALRLREDFLSLAQVDVSTSDIRDEGLEHLVDALLDMKVELIVLKATRAHLTARSGEILKRLLLECNDLEEIRVAGNKLGAVGLKGLCKASYDHPNLSVLDISANEIGVPGGEELGALLTSNNTLKEVDVSWNAIAGEDGQQLLQGLALNKSVQVFRASWNRLGRAALSNLQDVLNRPQVFYELDLRNCGLDERHHTFENSTHATPRLEKPITHVLNPRPVETIAPPEDAPEVDTSEELIRVPSIQRSFSRSQHSISKVTSAARH